MESGLWKPGDVRTGITGNAPRGGNAKTVSRAHHVCTSLRTHQHRIHLRDNNGNIRHFHALCRIAHAQFLFWPQYTFWPGHYAPFKHKHHHRQRNSESAKNARPEDAPKGPLQIIISIADQRVLLFDNGALIARSSVSTGTQGHPTPLGVFSVISKQRWHRSNIYSAAPMPYMQRITWSGIALHAGVVPGHPASHGCIRLPEEFAVK